MGRFVHGAISLAFLGQSGALRRSETEVAMTSLQSVFRQHPSLSKSSVLSSLGALSASKGSNVDHVFTEIKTNMEDIVSTVVSHHDATQLAVNNVIAELDQKTQDVVEAKGVADAADAALVQCRQEEQGLAGDISASAGRLFTKVIAREAKKAVAWGYTHIDKQVTLPDFVCDNADENCTASWTAWETQAKADILAVNQQVAENIQNYKNANQSWTDAIATAKQENDVLVGLQSDWYQKNIECNGKLTARDSAKCTFGSALRVKCDKKQEYDGLLTEVQESGSVQSHSDRVEEYQTAKLAICVVDRFLEEKSLDQIDVDCAEQIEVPFAVDLRDTYYQKLISPSNFTCQESEFAFANEEWTRVSRFVEPTLATAGVWHEEDSLANYVMASGDWSGAEPSAVIASSTPSEDEYPKPLSDDYVKTTGYTWPVTMTASNRMADCA